MKKELVSIIIPTYNRADLIKDAIISVLNQTYQNFEILVIDDGSTDNTKVIIESFKDNRIKYIWQEHSGLPAIARNNGLKIAKGEYLAFLNSDDLWLPKKIEKQLEVFKENLDVLLVATNGIFFSENYNFIRFPFKKNKRIDFRTALWECHTIPSSILMKKSVIETVGLMDENRILILGEDVDYWLRILNYKDKSIFVLKDPLTMVRIHDSILTTKTKSISLLEIYKNRRYVYDKFNDYDQNYIKMILLKHMYYESIAKKKKILINKEKWFFRLLGDKQIKLIDKLLVLNVIFLEKIYWMRDLVFLEMKVLKKFYPKLYCILNLI